MKALVGDFFNELRKSSKHSQQLTIICNLTRIKIVFFADFVPKLAY